MLLLSIAPVPPSCCHPPHHHRSQLFHQGAALMSLHTLLLPSRRFVRLSVSESPWCQSGSIQALCMCVCACACACVWMHVCTPTHTHTHIWVCVISSVPTSGSPNLIPLRAIYSCGGPLHTVWRVMTCVPASFVKRERATPQSDFIRCVFSCLCLSVFSLHGGFPGI